MNEVERLKILSSADRELLIEVRNKVLEIYDCISVIVSFLSKTEDALEVLLSYLDELKEIIEKKGGNLNV